MKATSKIPIGASAEKSEIVTKELTIADLHAGLPAVYSTPSMINLMEIAAASAILPYLPEGWISVGVAVNIKHLAATPVGLTVTAKAEAISVDDKTVAFNIEAHDGIEKIGEGTHVRAPVEKDRFVKRVRSKEMKQ